VRWDEEDAVAWAARGGRQFRERRAAGRANGRAFIRVYFRRVQVTAARKGRRTMTPQDIFKFPEEHKQSAHRSVARQSRMVCAASVKRRPRRDSQLAGRTQPSQSAEMLAAAPHELLGWRDWDWRNEEVSRKYERSLSIGVFVCCGKDISAVSSLIAVISCMDWSTPRCDPKLIDERVGLVVTLGKGEGFAFSGLERHRFNLEAFTTWCLTHRSAVSAPTVLVNSSTKNQLEMCEPTVWKSQLSLTMQLSDLNWSELRGFEDRLISAAVDIIVMVTGVVDNWGKEEVIYCLVKGVKTFLSVSRISQNY
jgi:hypothetical protein